MLLVAQNYVVTDLVARYNNSCLVLNVSCCTGCALKTFHFVNSHLVNVDKVVVGINRVQAAMNLRFTLYIS